MALSSIKLCYLRRGQMAGHGAQQQTKFGRLLELFDRVDGRVEVRAATTGSWLGSNTALCLPAIHGRLWRSLRPGGNKERAAARPADPYRSAR